MDDYDVDLHVRWWRDYSWCADVSDSVPALRGYLVQRYPQAHTRLHVRHTCRPKGNPLGADTCSGTAHLQLRIQGKDEDDAVKRALALLRRSMDYVFCRAPDITVI